MESSASNGKFLHERFEALVFDPIGLHLNLNVSSVGYYVDKKP